MINTIHIHKRTLAPQTIHSLPDDIVKMPIAVMGRCLEFNIQGTVGSQVVLGELCDDVYNGPGYRCQRLFLLWQELRTGGGF